MLDPEFVPEHWPLRAVSLGETFMTYPTRKVIQIHAAEGVFVELIAAGTTPCDPFATLLTNSAPDGIVNSVFSAYLSR